MVKMSLRALCQIGLDFFEFLNETERTSITDRLQLRDIYNNEFRRRTPGTKDPNFGSVLHALKVCNKITRRKDNIRFTPAVRDQYLDQWHTPRHTPRTHQAQPNRRASLEPGPDSSSADDAETGVRARRKLASNLMSKLRVDGYLAMLITDKHGISITADSPFENGKLVLCVQNTLEYVVKLNVKNTGPQSVYFTYYTPLHWLRYLSLSDEKSVTKRSPLFLNPGDSYEIEVRFRCELVGFFPATLAFEFKPDLEPATAAFHIVRIIEARCITSLGLELAPVAPYKPRSLPAFTPDLIYRIIDGQPPEGLSDMRLQYVVKLKQYCIPPYLNQLITQLKDRYLYSDKKKLLESPLSWENYTEKFQTLLYLEERQMEFDIRRYNIPNEDTEFAQLKRDTHNPRLLVLEVPGVSENRPSVLRGDSLLVYPQGEKEVKYRGYVHSVQLDSVRLGFSPELLNRYMNGKDFSLIEGIKFNVEFTFNRLTVRLQHRAAEFARTHKLSSVLFPAAPPMPREKPDLPTLKLFDYQLEKNPEQYQAVQHIVAGSSRPAPYLVFGPPGTGKTVTLVEAIKQIEKTQTFCHILACAPSNSAADLLCSKIREHVDEHKVYRVYASSRDPKLVPEHLKGCSNLLGDSYIFPAKEELMEFRIIVTTLLTAGRFVSGDIPPGHFTHIFVDEAGHAVETECLVPLAGLLNTETGQLVLAGDPKQLGPILRSPFALKYEMEMSLLERLMTNFPLYRKNDGVYNNCYVTKLLRNYRSHPAILKIPNELFYEGELQACAEEYSRNFYCRWEYLPKPGFPVIFHGVAGLDARESTSPSFFNVAEVEVLMDYVRKLLQSQGKKGVAKIAPKDIGIIAPYRKQVQKIRQALDKVGKDLKCKDMSNLKVGSVEEFQGQERRVILVSAVRSSANYMDFDKKFNLGFIKNEKRFNVAVTRAKALLIVVGNPLMLSADPNWASFIEYCKEEGGYSGFSHAEEDEEMIVAKLSELYISIEAEIETTESVVQQQLDPEWRNDM
ncbi:putative helicase mov-10-B.1 isoform X2 [Poecilia formosa]|uniref:putative helicase mov-10-B.1 isoform X2 n=1 Tax=Poecilia formosa TaxID=48698 RepID=UPI0007BA5A85|nr:PREDICTED: putative helicase MOV-10 isoform X2 [Poecilia formosa]